MTALNESDLAVSDPNMAACPDLQLSPVTVPLHSGHFSEMRLSD